METRRIILGMSGASGAILGIRLLEALQSTDIETHLIMSEWAEKTVALETEYTVEKVKTLASAVYTPGRYGSPYPAVPSDGWNGRMPVQYENFGCHCIRLFTQSYYAMCRCLS